jgi:hypothetical protein
VYAGDNGSSIVGPVAQTGRAASTHSGSRCPQTASRRIRTYGPLSMGADFDCIYTPGPRVLFALDTSHPTGRLDVSVYCIGYKCDGAGVQAELQSSYEEDMGGVLLDEGDNSGVPRWAAIGRRNRS